MSLAFPLWSRCVKQAFMQSDAKVFRQLFVRLPSQPPLLPLIRHPSDGLLQVKSVFTGSPNLLDTCRILLSVAIP